MANQSVIVEDMNFIKDSSGRIIKVVRGDRHADIKWSDLTADIEFCNFVIMIACETRGVGALNE